MENITPVMEKVVKMGDSIFQAGELVEVTVFDMESRANVVKTGKIEKIESTMMTIDESVQYESAEEQIKYSDIVGISLLVPDAGNGEGSTDDSETTTGSDTNSENGTQDTTADTETGTDATDNTSGDSTP